MSSKPKFSFDPPVTIAVPWKRDADAADALKHIESLVRGFRDSVARLGVNPASIPQLQRERILEQISEKISQDKVREIMVSADPKLRKRLIESVLKSVETIIQDSFPTFRRERAGAKRKNAIRDARIFQLRKRGWSWGKIANHEHVHRNTAQSAVRREMKRQAAEYEIFKKAQRDFKKMGIVIKEGE